MQHDYYTSENCGCREKNTDLCVVCGGGLAVCKVCGLYEGGLTSECPGEKAYKKADDVHKGVLDFRGGKWVNAVSCHCPANYRQSQDECYAARE